MRSASNNGLRGGGIFHVAMVELGRSERGGERLHPPAEMLALIGESSSAPSAARCLAMPSDRMIVGDTHDQAAFCRPSNCSSAASSAEVALEHSVALCAAEAERVGSTVLRSTPSRRSRTIGMSENFGSSSSMLALSQMKPFCIIRRQ